MLLINKFSLIRREVPTIETSGIHCSDRLEVSPSMKGRHGEESFRHFLHHDISKQSLPPHRSVARAAVEAGPCRLEPGRGPRSGQ